MDGLLVEVLELARGSQLSEDVAAATSLPVDDVSNFPTDGGIVDILGDRYTYTAVVPGVSVMDDAGNPTNPGTLTLDPTVPATASEGDPVVLVLAGDVATTAYAVVDISGGEDSTTPDGGDPPHVPLDITQRAVLPVGAYDPPLPITVSEDLTTVTAVPDVRPMLDGSLLDPATLPRVPTYSTADPPADGGGAVDDDVWIVTNADGSSIIAQYVWDATAATWQTRTWSGTTLIDVDADSLAAVLVLSTRIVAGDPAGARVELNSGGFKAFDADGTQTVKIDAATGNVSLLGNFRTGPSGAPGTVEITSWTSGGTTYGQIAFGNGIGGAPIAPSMFTDNLGTPNLYMYSGCQTATRLSALKLLPAQIRLGIAADVGSDATIDSGAQLYLDRQTFTLRSEGGDNTWLSRVDAVGDTHDIIEMVIQHVATGNLRGFQYINESIDQARILSNNTMDVVSVAASAYRGINASAFNVSSDRALKKDIAAPSVSALQALRSMPVYEYAYLDEDGGRRLGVMAEDVPTIATSLAAPADSDHFAAGTKVVSLSDLLALTIDAVRSLDAELDNVPGLRKTKPKRKDRTL